MGRLGRRAALSMATLAIVGWLGLVPTLVVLASTGVLAAVVAWTSPLRHMIKGSSAQPSVR